MVRLVAYLRRSGIPAARLTTQTLPPDLTLERLHQHFARSLARQFGREMIEPADPDRDELEAWLAAALPDGDRPCVVVLDEASGIPSDSVRGTFFRQLRAIHDARDQPWAPNLGSGLAIIFCGTFSPNRLAEDSLTSPFNVCVPYRTTELSRDDVRTLLDNVGLDELEAFIDPVMHAVGGQPYLIQYLLQTSAAGDPGIPAEERLSAALSSLSRGVGSICRAF
jgi:hypothetical protein